MASQNIENLQRENNTLKMHLASASQLIQRCKSWVGTDLGQDIAIHEAQVKGVKHNSQDWDMSDKNGEQGF